MEFLIKEGPWRELFKGTVESHEIGIYTNPNLTVLVSIVEKEGDVPIGLVLEAYKVFHATGELEAFVSALPKEATAIIKHSEHETEKFLLIASKPSYASYDEEKINIELEEILRNLEQSSEILKNITIAYELDLTEIKEAPDEIKEAFFSQPLLMQMLSPKYKKITALAEERRAISFGEVSLGLAKDGKAVKEPMAIFKKTIISEGKKSERMHAMHVLIEGCMLSGATAIILDWDNAFSGLSKPTKNTLELQKFGLEIDPIGFPVKDFFVGEQIKTEISTISPAGFPAIFGLGDNPASKKISELMGTQKFGSMEAFMKKVSEEKIETHFNDYQKHCALRFLLLVNEMYANLFGEQMDVKKISEGGIQGISRASIIHPENNDDREKLFVLDSLLNCFLEHFSKKGELKNLRAIVFIPNASKFLAREEQNKIAEEITEDLKKLEKYGIGFILETEKEIELQPAVREIAETRVILIKENDAGIHVKDEKVYRVELRPGLSTCSETTETEQKK
ncbi:MAG: hypothetical protein PHD95_06690 [Candidatus ainarchaeum sp.]|nr:hypothetical protein [Candidatus ainarchaeum sp.]